MNRSISQKANDLPYDLILIEDESKY